MFFLFCGITTSRVVAGSECPPSPDDNLFRNYSRCDASKRMMSLLWTDSHCSFSPVMSKPQIFLTRVQILWQFCFPLISSSRQQAAPVWTRLYLSPQSHSSTYSQMGHLCRRSGSGERERRERERGRERAGPRSELLARLSGADRTQSSVYFADITGESRQIGPTIAPSFHLVFLKLPEVLHFSLSLRSGENWTTLHFLQPRERSPCCHVCTVSRKSADVVQRAINLYWKIDQRNISHLVVVSFFHGRSTAIVSVTTTTNIL